MEIQKDKKEKIILWIYSILILIYAVFDIVVNILPKILTIPKIPNTTLINHFFILTGISLYLTPINMIVGYGLLRRRFWARYAGMAAMLTFLVVIFTQYLYLGIFSLFRYGIYIQFLFVVLTLLFLTWKRVRMLFGEHRPLKLKSWYAPFVIIIILLSFYSIFFSIFMKIKFNLPFSVDKPRVTILKKAILPEAPEKYLKVEIFNVSLLIPKEFIIRQLFKTEGKDYEWRVVFQNKGKEIRGIINLTNELPYGNEEEFRKRLGHVSKFDLEKYILTNNWNPGVAFIRSHYQKKHIGDLIDSKEIHMDGYRGFWERRQTDILFSGGFSLYKRREDQFIGGGYLLLKKYFDESSILTVLSSIEFLKPEDPRQANKHYERGLVFYQSGDILQAQVEFANAYYLSPGNPDYTFMLARSLYLRNQEFLDYTHIKDLLNNVLKIRPDYKEARRLLKEIGPRLPKEAKKLEIR
jgi:hypothetical protein